MSERKREAWSTPEEKPVCSLCGATKPQHFRDCSMIKDRLCPECQAMWPRHYPHCSRDVLKFSRWWVPKGVQKELMELYRAAKVYYEHQHGRLPVPPDNTVSETPANEQYVRPDIARDLLSEITRWLLAKRDPKMDGQKIKQELHAKINALTSGKRSVA